MKGNVLLADSVLNNNIMSEKHRNLPLWMVKSDVECSKDKEAQKKKSHEPTKRIAKKRRSVVRYWMNERELVETALSILRDDKARVTEEAMIIPETDGDTSDSEVQDRTYVPNIAEQETVPYHGHCMDTASTRTKLDCHLKPTSEKPNVDDEALDLVREIFFT